MQMLGKAVPMLGLAYEAALHELGEDHENTLVHMQFRFLWCCLFTHVNPDLLIIVSQALHQQMIRKQKELQNALARAQSRRVSRPADV